MITCSLNLNEIVLFQKTVWFALPLFPILLIFFIGAVAETNRAPFDLSEAESELVSGFMTEHSSVIFVFFFLAEYASILLMCILTASFFFGGYLGLDFLLGYPLDILIYCIQFIDIDYAFELKCDILFNKHDWFWMHGIILGVKSSILIFTFIWVRASLPRVRFDQLMSFGWTVLLPLLFAFIVFIPCVLYSFDAFPVDVSVLALPLLAIRTSDIKMYKPAVLR